VRQDAFLLVSGSVGGDADARGVYEISPAGLALGQMAEIRIAYADTASRPDELCVARVTGNGFVLLASFVDPERRQIVAYTDCLGLYTLRRVEGTTNPQLGASGVMLMQNYPNPFSGGTSIDYWISRPGHVKLYIVTVDGRLVKSLWDGEAAHAGMYRADWDRTDSSGKTVASGVYYLRADSDAGNATKKLVVAN
jgi:hypothetical protein